jgi:hypothetical protein
MSINIGLGVPLVRLYVFTKKYISICIYPFSGIHNTSLTSAYFGLDIFKRECLEYLYLFIYSTPHETQFLSYSYVYNDEAA